MKYQVGGSLSSHDPTYVVRQADRQLYQALQAGEFCYVLNSRQMGKSSLLQRVSRQLQEEGCLCLYLDVTQLGSANTTAAQWYRGILTILAYQLDLPPSLALKPWLEEQADLSPVQQLHRFVEEVMLPAVSPDRLFIFVDEIDSLLSLEFSTDDFFAWIRHCYHQRSHNPSFNRLGIALFGVATPSDLIADKRRTPFNIGTAIELRGFQFEEATPLLEGLIGYVSQPELILKHILSWTGGQPFLTQKLCQLVLQAAWQTPAETYVLPAGTGKAWVDHLVQSQIIQQWESQDEPEHLRTIRDRLLFNESRSGRLLGIYQQILQSADGVLTDDSIEQADLLLTGLVEKRGEYLQVKNPIYRAVFSPEWVTRQLEALRPYAQALNAWIASHYQDESRLLRGQALQDVLGWTQQKNLGSEDYRFLAASQELERREVQRKLEAERLVETEARLRLEQKSARRQRQMLIGLSVALAAAIVSGINALFSYRQTAVREVEALVVAANGSFEANQRLESLVRAIEARQKFQRLSLFGLGEPETLDAQTREALEQAVYGADEVNRLSGHQGLVISVAYSPDGQWIATGSYDRTVKLWRRDGTLVRTIPQGASIEELQFSPNSQQIATAGVDGAVRLWNLDGTLKTQFPKHGAAVWRVAFSPDGSLLASGSGDRTVKLWKLDGTLVQTFKHKRGVWGLAFLDRRTIVSGTVGGTHYLWKVDGTLVKTFEATGAPTNIWRIAVSPDGTRLATAHSDNQVRIWSRDGGLLNTLEGHTGEVRSVKFSPDSKQLVSVSADKTIRLWDTNGMMLRTFRGHRGTIRDVAFSPDGQEVVSVSDDNEARLWRVNSSLVKSLDGHRGLTYRLAFSPKGDVLAAAAGTVIKRWRQDGTPLPSLVDDDPLLLSLTFSPDGRTLAAVGSRGDLRVWNVGNRLSASIDRRQRSLFRASGSGLLGVAYTPDGQWVVTGGIVPVLNLWQRRPDGQFQLQQSIPAHTARIWDVAVSPDGRQIATASSDGTVKLWNWQTPKQLSSSPALSLEAHQSEVLGVAFSPDGNFLASSGGDDRLRLWKRDGTLVWERSANGIGLTRVAFSPDGQRLATGGFDNTVRLWSRDGQLLTVLRGHTSVVSTIAFSPDGKRLASSGDDQTVLLWNLEKILQFDLLAKGCKWVRTYLRTNAAVTAADRDRCHS